MYMGAIDPFTGVNTAYSLFPRAVQLEAQRCEDAGGFPIIGYNAYDANRSPIPSSAYVRVCQMPERAQVAPAAPAAPISISVPTQIATQISPQISPVFVQQDEPRDSPVTAATTAMPVMTPTQTAPVLHWADPEPQAPAPVKTQPAQPYEETVMPPAPWDYTPPAPQSQSSPGFSPGMVMAGAALLLGVAFVMKGK